MRRIALAAIVALAVGLTGCGPGAGKTGSAVGAGSPSPAPGGRLTVFVAASLTEPFTRIGKDFEAANPDITIVYDFAGSVALSAQIVDGAPADVFVSAAPATVRPITKAGINIGEPATAMTDKLVIAVAKGNPKAVKGLSDLSRPGLRVALCTDGLPCAEATKTVLDNAKMTLSPVMRAQDAKAAVTRVQQGTSDAAVVFSTDVRASGLAVVEFPESAGALGQYPIVALKGGTNKPGAQAFIDYVLTGKGKDVLLEAGFQAP